MILEECAINKEGKYDRLERRILGFVLDLMSVDVRMRHSPGYWLEKAVRPWVRCWGRCFLF